MGLCHKPDTHTRGAGRSLPSEHPQVQQCLAQLANSTSLDSFQTLLETGEAVRCFPPDNKVNSPMQHI
eukprot:12883739-Prorocentrum_lima.AAC.1